MTSIVLVGLAGCADPEPAATPLPSGPEFPYLANMVYLPAASEGGLLIDRFEVTDAQFAEYVAAVGDQVARDPGEDPPQSSSFLSHWETRPSGEREPRELETPVRNVTLAEAERYAQWRSASAEMGAPSLSLPTLAQWEIAYPGVRTGRNPWAGDALVSVCNIEDTELGRPSAVGAFEFGRSEDGCYDLKGNVAEWTRTRVGGLAFVMGDSFATSSRFGSELVKVAVDQRFNDVGFRCVLADADRHLEAIIDQIEQLQGERRRRAIRELLRVGQPARGSNRILPFLDERLLRSRVQWQWSLPEADLARGAYVSALERSPLPLIGRREGLLVVGGGTVFGLDGQTGEQVFRRDLPVSGLEPRTRGLVESRDTAWLWVATDSGSVWLGDLRSEQTIELPAPDGLSGVLDDAWVFASPATNEALLVVQDFQLKQPELTPPVGPLSRWVRVIRRVGFRGEPAVERRIQMALRSNPVYASPVPPLRPNADGWLLARSAWFPATFFGSLNRGNAPLLVHEGVELELLDPETLATLDWQLWTTSVAFGDPSLYGDGARRPPALQRGLDPLGYYTEDQDGALVLLRASRRGIEIERLGGGGPNEAWEEATLGQAESMIRSITPLGNAEQVQWSWLRRDRRGALTLLPVASLAVSSGITWATSTPRPHRRLVFSTISGALTCLDLEVGVPVWQEPAGTLPGHGHRIAELAVDGGVPVLLGQPDSYRLVIRHLDHGDVVDEFRSRRSSLRPIELVEIDNDGWREPVVLLDGVIVAVGDAQTEAAALAREFKALAGENAPR